MAEDRQALLELYRQTRADLLAVLDGLTEAQLTEPTLDGWAVTDHLLHLAWWDDIRAVEVERISAGHASSFQMTDAQDEDFNLLGYALRRGMPTAQAQWELARSRQRLLDALEAATPRGLDSSLYGAAGLASGHEAEHTGWIKRWRAEKHY
jgi:hypothetical protein